VLLCGLERRRCLSQGLLARLDCPLAQPPLLFGQAAVGLAPIQLLHEAREVPLAALELRRVVWCRRRFPRARQGPALHLEARLLGLEALLGIAASGDGPGEIELAVFLDLLAELEQSLKGVALSHGWMRL